MDGRKFSTVVSSSTLSVTRGNAVHRLAARALIRDWDDAMLSDSSAEHCELQRSAKAAITDLSITYSLVSKYTSFVAVEERTQGETQTSLDLQALFQAENVDKLQSQGFESTLREQDLELDLLTHQIDSMKCMAMEMSMELEDQCQVQ